MKNTRYILDLWDSKRIPVKVCFNCSWPCSSCMKMLATVLTAIFRIFCSPLKESVVCCKKIPNGKLYSLRTNLRQPRRSISQFVDNNFFHVEFANYNTILFISPFLSFQRPIINISAAAKGLGKHHLLFFCGVYPIFVGTQHKQTKRDRTSRCQVLSADSGVFPLTRRGCGQYLLYVWA